MQKSGVRIYRLRDNNINCTVLINSYDKQPHFLCLFSSTAAFSRKTHLGFPECTSTGWSEYSIVQRSVQRVPLDIDYFFTHVQSSPCS